MAEITEDQVRNATEIDESQLRGRYPQPKSFTQDDQDVGLETGAISSARLPGTALSIPLRPSMSEVEFDQRAAQLGHDIGRVESAAGGAAAGGLAGAALKGALAGNAVDRFGPYVAPASSSAASGIRSLATRAVDALSHPTQTAIAGGILGHGVGHGVGGTIAGLLTPLALRMAIASAPYAGRAATAVLPEVGATTGAALGTADMTPASPLSTPRASLLFEAARRGYGGAE